MSFGCWTPRRVLEWLSCYMESSAVSEYRLKKTFKASPTSYRLLMFINLMRRGLLGKTRSQPRTLDITCDQLFASRGMPDPGVSLFIAEEIRCIQKIDNFFDFFAAMDIKNMPSRLELTGVLRDTVKDSMKRGFSKWALRPYHALYLRRLKEPEVETIKDLKAKQLVFAGFFFPR